jgi:hypothetical protein
MGGEGKGHRCGETLLSWSLVSPEEQRRSSPERLDLARLEEASGIPCVGSSN